MAKSDQATALRVLAISGAMILGLGIAGGQWYPNQYEGGRSKDEKNIRQRNSSATARIAGELRATFSDMVFIKSDRYMHAGVAYVSAAEEDLSLAAAENKAESEAGHAHEGAGGHLQFEPVEPEKGVDEFSNAPAAHQCQSGKETVIKSADKDYRGWVGDLHRAVAAFRDPKLGHMHTESEEILPWFRVATLNDPHFVRGFCVGAYWLKTESLDEAITFAEEGRSKNPDAFQIHLTLGELYMDKARGDSAKPLSGDLSPEASMWVLRAKASFQRSAELVLKQRPQEMDALPESSPWQSWWDTDAMRATEMAALLEVRFGDKALGQAYARKYLELYPDSPSLRRTAQAL